MARNHTVTMSGRWIEANEIAALQDFLAENVATGSVEITSVTLEYE